MPKSTTQSIQLPIADILRSHRQYVEQLEKERLHPKAALSMDHNRFFGAENDYRLPYKRDVDRIVHSKAYARYADKTQVAYLITNDHIAHRSLHVQLVSNFARGIAEILRFNVDLVEAIALGHDVGHPPFGHEGEEYLSALSIEYENGPFSHPYQSCRLFTSIEPLNLGLNVFDGFLCHDGGMCGNKLIPNFGKTWTTHLEEKSQKQQNPDQNIWPGTLEGCLVKICDTMSYLGRDIEDAISLGILQRDDIPQTMLGNTNREMLNLFAEDLIKHSYNQDYIAISQEVYDTVKIIRNFNFERIYTHPKLKCESDKIQRSYRLLFEMLLQDLKTNNHNSYIWTNFLYNKAKTYLDETTPVQMVIDYISGMTDRYFIATVKKLIVPTLINIS